MQWPVTPWTLAALREWARMESPNEENGETLLFNRCYNPLATTLAASEVTRSSKDIGFGPGKWNNANAPHGVAIYDVPDNGVKATAATITIPWAYAAIRDTFKTQRVADRAGLLHNFTTWIGSIGYATELTDFMINLKASKEAVPVAGDGGDMAATVARMSADLALLTAVVCGNGARARDGTILTGRAALEDQAQRGNSLALGVANTQEKLAELAGQVLALAQKPSVSGVSRAELVAALETLTNSLKGGK